MNNTITSYVKEFYNSNFENYKKYRKKNKYYYDYLLKNLKFIVPENKRVLDIGCGLGDTLSFLKPSYGLGVDISEKIINENKEKYPELDFKVLDAQKDEIEGKFDYIIIVNTIGNLEDIWDLFRNLKKNCHPFTKVVIIYYNYLWQPILKIAEKIKLRMPQPDTNWLNFNDIFNLLYLNGYEKVKYGFDFIFPYKIPLISNFINKLFSNLPFIHRLGLINYVVARPSPNVSEIKNYSVSVIIPTKNEKGNIQGAVYRTPNMGLHTELVFVDGHSTDGTKEEILQIIEKEKGNKDIKFIEQDGKGKADAVHKGFNAASGDILMILDSDLTVPPEDLIKFYKAMEENKGEFINGCRLVYPMEKEAMRKLNRIANRFFAVLFSFIIGQTFKDTLCGTKVLRKTDYAEVMNAKKYFGDFDPFGDFELIFGAAKNNLKTIEIPIRYKNRVYGDIKINRFKDGLELLKMAFIAFIRFRLKISKR